MSKIEALCPDFSRPGRQPKGDVRLDFDHPFARDLSGLWLGSKSRGPYMLDLVNRMDMSLSGGTVALSAGAGGIGPKTTGGFLYSANNINISSATYSALLVAEITSIPSYGGIFGRNKNGANDAGFALQKNSTSDVFIIFHNDTTGSTLANLKPSSILNKGLQAILLTYDGTSNRAYLNGVLQDTVSNTSVGTGAGPAIIFNPRDLLTSVATSGTAYLYAIWNHALSDAEALSVSKDPYQMLDPVPHPFFGVTVSGGGTAYSASLALGIQMATADNTGLDAVGAMSLGVQAATNDNAGLAAVGGVSLGMAAGVSEAGNMATVSALTLGLQAGLTDNAINALAGAVSLGSQMGLGASDKLGIQAATALGLILALTPSDTAAIGAALSLGAMFGLTPSQGSTSQYQAALALGVITSTGAGDNLAAASSLALGLGLAITTASIDQITGSMTLGVIAGAGVNAGQTFAVNIPLGLIAGLQNSGGQSYGATMALGMVLGQAIAAATGLQVVPSERILAVQAENRTLSIQIEGRTLIVSVENRTISVKLE